MTDVIKCGWGEIVAWRTFDGEGGYELRNYEYNETYRDEYIARNGEGYSSWVEPLSVTSLVPDGLWQPIAWFDPVIGLPYGWTEQPPADNAVWLYTSTPGIRDGWQAGLQAHFRKILQHHGLMEHGDGVVEGDLIDAVVTALTKHSQGAT